MSKKKRPAQWRRASLEATPPLDALDPNLPAGMIESYNALAKPPVSQVFTSPIGFTPDEMGEALRLAGGDPMKLAAFMNAQPAPVPLPIPAEEVTTEKILGRTPQGAQPTMHQAARKGPEEVVRKAPPGYMPPVQTSNRKITLDDIDDDQLVTWPEILAPLWTDTNITLETKEEIVRAWAKSLAQMIAEANPDDVPLDQEALLTEIANIPFDRLADTFGHLENGYTEMLLSMRAHGFLDSWKRSELRAVTWEIPGAEDSSTPVGTAAKVGDLVQRGEQRAMCPNCHTVYDLAAAALSRREAVLICPECGDKEGMHDFMATRSGDLEQEVTIESVMIANSNQLRRLAGNSHRFGLGFGLDFRLDTVMDSNGLHVLSGTELAFSAADGPVINCQVTIKIAHLAPDEPIEEIPLTVRVRDWLRLQRFTDFDRGEIGQSYKRTFLVRDVIPDEWSPNTINPRSARSTGQFGTIARSKPKRGGKR